MANLWVFLIYYQLGGIHAPSTSITKYTILRRWEVRTILITLFTRCYASWYVFCTIEKLSLLLAPLGPRGASAMDVQALFWERKIVRRFLQNRKFSKIWFRLKRGRKSSRADAWPNEIPSTSFLLHRLNVYFLVISS